MKTFKELQPGDIIYYYDHCKMKPRKVLDCKVETEERKRQTWNGYEVIIDKKLVLTFERGPKIKIWINRNEGNITEACGNCSMIYSCKEAAINELNRLYVIKKRKVERMKKKVEAYTNIMNRYELLNYKS